MVTYYDDGSIRITSNEIVLDGHAFPLPALARVWHRRGARSWRALAGRGALGSAMVAPIVAAVLGLFVALRIDASATVTIALVGGACLVGLAAGPLADVLLERMDRSYARGSRELQIWAQVHRQPVLLLQTDDALRFGQVYRALQRALELTALNRVPDRPRYAPTAPRRAPHAPRRAAAGR